MKKIVAFIGSPRKKANTTSIVNEIVRGAKEAGAEIKIYDLYEMNLKPCHACYYCRSKAGCSIEDDMQEVYADIKDAEAIVIGSPIYLSQLTSQVVLLFERLFPLMGADFRPRFGIKKTAMVYSQGQSNVDMYKQYFEQNDQTLKKLGLVVVDTIISFGGGSDTETAVGNEALMARAFKTGEKLVE